MYNCNKREPYIITYFICAFVKIYIHIYVRTLVCLVDSVLLISCTVLYIISMICVYNTYSLTSQILAERGFGDYNTCTYIIMCLHLL